MLRPTNWNVVVAGSWNRAILTPGGIAKLIFGLPDKAPIEVYVPLDSVDPYKVKHEGLIVLATSKHLIVEAENPTIELLAAAMGAAARAVDGLPKTPLQAVGINLRFESSDLLAPIDEVVGSQWDDRLSDADFRIRRRSVARSLEWGNGTINVTVGQEGASQKIELNFERQSASDQEHLDWLRLPASGLTDAADKILTRTLNLPADQQQST